MDGMNPETLLSSASATRPCGEPLDGSAELLELENATKLQRGKRPDEWLQPKWFDVRERAAKLLARSKDLRIAVILARAELNIDGFVGLRNGLSLIRGLIERYWDDLYPPRDDGETARNNIIHALGAFELFDTNRNDLRSDISHAPLITSPRFGPITYRTISQAMGLLPHSSPPKDTMLDAASIAAAFEECDVNELSEIRDAVDGCLSEITGIEKKFPGNPSAEPGQPNIIHVRRLLEDILTFLAEKVALRSPAIRQPENGEDIKMAMATSPTTENGRGLTSIASRQDVIKSLEMICAYYEANEPSSPVPVLLKRARRLVTMDFIEIVKELAPDALAQIEKIRGSDGGSGAS